MAGRFIPPRARRPAAVGANQDILHRWRDPAEPPGPLNRLGRLLAAERRLASCGRRFDVEHDRLVSLFWYQLGVLHHVHGNVDAAPMLATEVRQARVAFAELVGEVRKLLDAAELEATLRDRALAALQDHTAAAVEAVGVVRRAPDSVTAPWP